MKEKSKHAQAKVKRVLGEYKKGTLKSSSGEKVTKKSQALAIAMHEAGLSRSDEKGKKC